MRRRQTVPSQEPTAWAAFPRRGLRRLFYLGLAVFLGLLPAASPAAAAGDITLVVNGAVVRADVPPVIVDGRTLVPIRVVSESLGAQVSWEATTRVATIVSGASQIVLKVGEVRATVDGAPVTLDSPARIINGRTMVPIRFVGEALGATVAWDATKRQVSVTRTPAVKASVEGLSWEKSSGVARFVVVTNGPVHYQVKTLQRNEQYPDRVLIDVDTAVLKIAPETSVGVAGVERVRAFVQDLGGGSSIARVVFDTAEPVRFDAWATWDASPPLTRKELPADLQEGQEAIVLEVQYKLTGVEFINKAGDERVVVHFNGPPGYEVWEASSPWRIVIDAARTTLSDTLDRAPAPVGVFGITQVRVGQFQTDPDISRVVLDADKAVPYSVVREGDDLVVYFGDTATITGFGYEPRDTGGRLQIWADRPLTATVSRLTGPDRLVLEIAGARLGGQVQGGGTFTAGDDLVETITYSEDTQGQTKVRFTLSLNAPVAAGLASNDQGLSLSVSRSPLAGKVVVIDPGHGGNDPGAIASNGVRETTLTLTIGTKLAELLRSAGATVYLTRSTSTENPDKYARVGFANSVGADAMVALHLNANERPAVCGTETYYYDNHPASKRLAEAILARVVKALGRPSGGARWADFVATREPHMPAALVEGLYMTNADDLALLMNPATLEAISQAIFEGLLDFFAVPSQ